jgi:hypothetical protein
MSSMKINVAPSREPTPQGRKVIQRKEGLAAASEDGHGGVQFT